MKNTEIFKSRRELLGDKFARTLFIIPSGAVAQRSHSVNYRYKTPSDFFYLTGLEIPEAILVVAGHRSYLLCGDANAKELLWGDREVLSAMQLLHLSLESLSRFEHIIEDHIKDFDRVALSLGRDHGVEQKTLGLISYGRRSGGVPIALCDARLLVGILRMQKDAKEIQYMREAAQRSSQVHAQLMQQHLVGKTEKEVCNWIEAGFLKQGMSWTAYETIVGSGVRSTVLHARATDKTIADGELVLIDAGGEWNSYCADITRVIPAGLGFSEVQKNIYQKVLDIQKQVIEAVAPGRTLQELHTMVTTFLGETFVMPHKTSHWLGLDVHDPAPYVDERGNPIQLVEGMTFTVEPGIYLPESGFGIRIEDDILVTKTGFEVLSTAPKELEQIEAMRSSLQTMV